MTTQMIYCLKGSCNKKSRSARARKKNYDKRWGNGFAHYIFFGWVAGSLMAFVLICFVGGF